MLREIMTAKKPIRVVVGSGNRVKVEAARKAFTKHFPDCLIEVTGMLTIRREIF